MRDGKLMRRDRRVPYSSECASSRHRGTATIVPRCPCVLGRYGHSGEARGLPGGPGVRNVIAEPFGASYQARKPYPRYSRSLPLAGWVISPMAKTELEQRGGVGTRW